MNILLIPNPAKKQAYELAHLVQEFLQKKSITVVAPKEQSKELGVGAYDANLEIALIISLGGDGSILKIVQEFPELDAPIMGVNLGTLGFLADIPVSEMFDAINEWLLGSYTVQDRLMIEGYAEEGCASFLAVNEVVVHRGKNHTLIDLALFVDGKYLNTFSADGVIIATPSGSTAYSLSAGGPIITPDLDAIVVTPICPHAVSNRPIVLKINEELKIQCLSNHTPVEVSFDGIYRFSLSAEQSITIRRATRRFRLVSLKSHDYFETLRTKLGWTGTLKA
jgi:NAD+ kinase